MDRAAEGPKNPAPRNHDTIGFASAAPIATGGALGGGLRWSVAEAFATTDGWPWAVFIVNIVGCAALGALVAGRAHLSDRAFIAATVGFCGALTTFSTFAVDLAMMARQDRVGLLAGYLAASFTCGLAAYVAGHRIGRQRWAFGGRP